jgi:4,5-dihydroxyphthalate decarboxylase
MTTGMSRRSWMKTAAGLAAAVGGGLGGRSASASTPGKTESYFLPEGFPLEQGPAGVDESELLLSGGCDAVIAPITPKAFAEANPNIRQLFEDPAAVERAYYKKTDLFPIMHAVAIRKDAISADPRLPKAVFEMYTQAKQMAYADMETDTSLKITLPWVSQELEETRALMGQNFWRYGIEANRKELDLIMRYTHEQGLVKRRGEFAKMFDPSTLSLLG